MDVDCLLTSNRSPMSGMARSLGLLIALMPYSKICQEMPYSIYYSTQFKKDFRRCEKRGLPKEYKPHKLSGNRLGQWECHIKPDWLLVWEQNDNKLTLLMLNTGTHSDIFD